MIVHALDLHSSPNLPTFWKSIGSKGKKDSTHVDMGSILQAYVKLFSFNFRGWYTPMHLFISKIKPDTIDRKGFTISKECVYTPETYLKTEIESRFQAPQNQSPNVTNGNSWHPKDENGQTLR